MKLLLNMNLPRRLLVLLENLGHQCRHVGDIGMASADDRSIVELARGNGEIILTHDLDYGNILAFSGDSHPSVIIFRLTDAKANSLAQRLSNAWPLIRDALERGAVVTISDRAVRIRHLPIDR